MYLMNEIYRKILTEWHVEKDIAEPIKENLPAHGYVRQVMQVS